MSQELIESFEKISEQNPNPVFSVSKEGVVLHANRACLKELDDWGVAKGSPAPEGLKSLIELAFESTRAQKQSLSCTDYLYDFEVTPFGRQDFDFALIYGNAPKKSQEKRLANIKRLDNALFSEKKNRLLVEKALDGIITIDDKGVMLTFNPAAEKIFGYTAEEAVGKNISHLMPEPVSSEHDGYLEKYFKTGIKHIIGFSREVMGLRKDGVSFPLELNVSEMIWEGNTEFVGIVRDISQRRQLEEKLQRLSIIDGLTEIDNRRSFDETLDKEWKRAMRDQIPLSLILMDIDCFKLYNDTYGHQAGDTCLKQVAATLKHYVQRPADLVARYGGEEFVVVLPETSAEGALNMAENLRLGIEGLKVEHDKNSASPYVTVSMGVSTLIPTREILCETIIANADKALYQAKENGRNQVKVKNDDA
ncbi:MAG: diguanylate cyclase [Nitrospinaceae bacterium]|nr:diguanylate cyclase [Nitrospina sp.]MBT5375578.1 diguanylate cyclase [Nitrospinaceae bacterium]MBT6346335.1 diguanylate cyclase [Nitrospina sp.]